MSTATNAPKPSLSLQLEAAQAENNNWRALCAFLLNAEEPMSFLRFWNEGNFEACQREWPEAPPEVYPSNLQLLAADLAAA